MKAHTIPRRSAWVPGSNPPARADDLLGRVAASPTKAVSLEIITSARTREAMDPLFGPSPTRRLGSPRAWTSETPTFAGPSA